MAKKRKRKRSIKKSHKRVKRRGRRHYPKKQNQWLDWLKIKKSSNFREVQLELNDGIGAGYITVDGFQQCEGMYKGVVYEFWGDYWHGNLRKYASEKFNRVCKKTMKELWEDTMRKRQRIIEAGYFLIEVWESDWEVIQRGGLWDRKVEGSIMTIKARKI